MLSSRDAMAASPLKSRFWAPGSGVSMPVGWTFSGQTSSNGMTSVFSAFSPVSTMMMLSPVISFESVVSLSFGSLAASSSVALMFASTPPKRLSAAASLEGLSALRVDLAELLDRGGRDLGDLLGLGDERSRSSCLVRVMNCFWKSALAFLTTPPACSAIA